MRPTLLALGLLIAVGTSPAKDDPQEPIRSAVVFDGHLLCLSESGEVSAWDVKKWEYAKDVAKKFTRKGLLALAAGGDKLWAADDATLYQWSAKANEWEKSAGFDADKEKVVAVVPVGSVPYVVLPSKVIEPVGKKTFKLPEDRREYDVSATHATESMLWIGTDSGEWGGRLLGLDPKADKWVEERNSLGYVTGITHAAKGEVIVSWSMSHFSARTQIKIHKADAEVKTEHDEIEGKYYQRLAYSRHDETLYGIEADELVTIKDGKPTKVAKLEGDVFEREPNAMGVAPGIRDIFPVGPKTVVVVPNSGTPWVVQKGEVTRLKRP